MLCKNPYTGYAVPVGCGQCNPCRINRRRVWAGRQLFESLCHEENSFLTLTYSNEFLPEGGSLVPEHLQKWIKRFRKAIEPRKVRFFAVGEYGDETFRPHYHASLFGVGPSFVDVVRRTWGMGHVGLYEFNQKTAQYVSAYVVKKMTSFEDPRLDGRHPEFARMSLRPGIGAEFMARVGVQLLSGPGFSSLALSGDVPFQLNHDGRSVPLGRYLRKRLQDECEIPEEWRSRARQKWINETEAGLLPLLEAALADSKNLATVKSVVAERDLGKITQVEARSKIFDQKRRL